MKRICLIRHAKAEKPASDDFNRKLTEEGKAEARLLGKSLETDGFVCDMIISSGASRAFETAEIIGKCLTIKQRKIRIENSLYQGTGIDTYYTITKVLDNSLNSVIISGHNTTMDAAAKDMYPSYDRRMTTSAAVCIEFDTENWNNIQPGTGRLFFYKFNTGKKRLMDDEKKYIEKFRKETLSEIETIITRIQDVMMLQEKKKISATFIKTVESIFCTPSIITIRKMAELNNPDLRQER